MTSDAGADDTYALGETVRVTVTFSEAVDATGSPRLKIDMDRPIGAMKWAVYESGNGTDSLTFAYEVVEPNAPAFVQHRVQHHRHRPDVVFEAGGAPRRTADAESHAAPKRRSFLDRVDDKTSTRAPSTEPQPLTVGVSRRCC